MFENIMRFIITVSLICFSVCLFVNKTTQNVMAGMSRNLGNMYL